MSGLAPLFMAAIRALPRKAMSRQVRRAAAVRSKMAVRQFAARFDVDLSEAEKPLEAYDSVLELFTRRLRPGARPIDASPGALVAPVDGRVAQQGAVADGRLPQAKGRTYGLDALLAEPGAAARCREGAFCTLYLAPRDYHRVHAPVDARILGYTYVPGDLFPVNAVSTAHVDALYARNERVITHLDAGGTRVDVVKVGATNVGCIRLAYAPQLRTNTASTSLVRVSYEAPVVIHRGDELAVFELGSTVIVVTERPVTWAEGSTVRMGQALGRWRAA